MCLVLEEKVHPATFSLDRKVWSKSPFAVLFIYLFCRGAVEARGSWTHCSITEAGYARVGGGSSTMKAEWPRGGYGL